MNVKVKFSNQNPNTREMSDTYFAEGGGWEANRGRFQTRRFAECFVRNFEIPCKGNFSFLDMGCALGDALPVIHDRYPDAVLYGTDFSDVAVRRCTEKFGSIAKFFTSSLDALDRHYDVIFLSNVIEHIENYVEIVRALTEYCDVLYALTPYNEHIDGRKITPELGYHHVVTLDEHIFDSILEGSDLQLKHKVFKCTGAWDYSFSKKLKSVIGIHKLEPRLQIGYEFTHRLKPGNNG